MTEYYGTKGKRLKMVAAFDRCTDDIDNKKSAAGFLNSKGLLMEYAVQSEFTYMPVLRLEKEKTGSFKNLFCDDRWKELKAVDYNGERYYVGDEFHGSGVQESMFYMIYKELPAIYDDDTFRWRENIKYAVKETTIKSGSFEYHIIVRANDEAYIQVQYTKCENKHRTKVTIADLTVYNVSNEAIKEAIDEWKSEFKKDMDDMKGAKI